jgi:hypothetical protein
MQPIFTRLAEKHNKAIISGVFIDLCIIIANATIADTTITAKAVSVTHDLPHPVPLNTAATPDQTRVIGIAQAMQLPASTSPSVSMA